MPTLPDPTLYSPGFLAGLNAAAGRAIHKHPNVGPWLLHQLRRRADILEEMPMAPLHFLAPLAQGIPAEAVMAAEDHMRKSGMTPDQIEWDNTLARWLEDNAPTGDWPHIVPQPAQHPQYRAVLSLINAIIAGGFNPVQVNDGGDEWEFTRDAHTMADAVCAVDEATIAFSDKEQHYNARYRVFVVLGNEDYELAADGHHPSSDEGNRFWGLVDAWSDAEEERAYPSAAA